MGNYDFTMIPNRALFDQELGHAAFRLLAIIGSHRNKNDGWSWPGRKLLAKEMGYGGRDENATAAISALVKELATRGYIDYRPGVGRTPSHYRVIYDAPPPSAEDIEAHSDVGKPQNSEGGDSPTSQGGLFPPQTRKLNQKTKPEDSIVQRSFEEFYAAYPRKEGRGQAEKAWRAAIKIDMPITIIAALKRQLPLMTQKERQFIKLPATWLNGKCWLDETAPPKSDTAGMKWL